MFFFEIEKKASKNVFDKLLDQMNHNPQYNQNRQCQSSASRGNVFTRT